MTQKPAAAHEALGEKIPFSYRDVDYLVDPTSEWDFEAVENFENGRIATFLRLVLGDEQYAAMKKTNRTVGEVDTFAEELQKALGIQGN